MSVVDDSSSGSKSGKPPSGSPPSKWAQAAGGPPGYDPSKFYTSSSDARGHNTGLTLRFPPDVLREVALLTDTKAYPYQRVADFVRDAVHRLLHTRNDQLGDPKIQAQLEEFFVLRDAEEQLAAATRASERWGDLQAAWETPFVQFAKDGAWGQLWRHVHLAIDVVERAPEPYRSNLLTLLEAWLSKVPPEFHGSVEP
jgi:hypothetical protein